jgi:hypothetical protein
MMGSSESSVEDINARIESRFTSSQKHKVPPRQLTRLVFLKCSLKLGQTAMFVRRRNGLERVYVAPGIPLREFALNNRRHVLGLTKKGECRSAGNPRGPAVSWD